MKTLAAYVEFDPETKLYAGIVPGLPGAWFSTNPAERVMYFIGTRTATQRCCLTIGYEISLAEN